MASQADADRDLMRRALALAERGWGRVAPNPLVGAVVERQGEVVGEGWHTAYGEPHAEVMALRAAGERARGATVHVTLEPCNHHGKTPPCADALIAAGVSRVVFAVADPDPAARGGAAHLRDAGIDVVSGIEEQAARDLNASFFHQYGLEAARPWVELKLALSLDMCIADSTGNSRWITGSEARAEVHRLRAGHDAVAVGIGTALADDPSLTVRGGHQPRVPPVRVVLDRALRLPLTSRLVATARDVPVYVVAGRQASNGARRALEDAGVRVLLADDLDGALAALRDAGVRSLLCEGGAGIAAALLRADRVDRLSLFQAPMILGDGALSPFAGLPARSVTAPGRWRRLRTASFGEDTFVSLARMV